MKFLDYAYKKMNTKEEYPTLRSRTFSNFIDLLIVFVLLYPINYFFSDFLISDELKSAYNTIQSLGSESPKYNEALETFNKVLEPQKKLIYTFQLLQIVFLGVYLFLSWFYTGSTPGKMIMGMKIVDFKTQQKPSIKQLLIRLIVGIPSGGLLMIGFLWAVFNKQKRTLHDLASGTLVTRCKRKQKNKDNS
jgi:uncharacterized RDD family membrane protein YckC